MTKLMFCKHEEFSFNLVKLISYDATQIKRYRLFTNKFLYLNTCPPNIFNLHNLFTCGERVNKQANNHKYGQFTFVLMMLKSKLKYKYLIPT